MASVTSPMAHGHGCCCAGPPFRSNLGTSQRSAAVVPLTEALEETVGHRCLLRERACKFVHQVNRELPSRRWRAHSRCDDEHWLAELDEHVA